MIYKLTNEQLQHLQDLVNAAITAYGQVNLQPKLDAIQTPLQTPLTAEQIEEELEAMQKEDTQ